MTELKTIERAIFSPAFTDDGKAVEINLEMPGEEWKRISFTPKAYNDFLKIIVKAMGFEKGNGVIVDFLHHHKKTGKVERFDGKSDENFTFAAYSSINLLPEKPTGWSDGAPIHHDNLSFETDESFSIGQLVNGITNCWMDGLIAVLGSTEPHLSEKWGWKHLPGQRTMKFVWINEFIQRLTAQLKYKTKSSKKYEGNGEEYWDEIRQKVIIEADRYMPRYRELGGKTILVDEGGICDDPQLILGLLLSNPKYFNFSDCNLENFEDIVYVRDLAKKCKGGPCSYHPIDLVWESKSKQHDEWTMHIPEELMTEAEKRRAEMIPDWHTGQVKRELENKPLAFDNKMSSSRAWIVKEATFCGRFRLTAKKISLNRNKEEIVVTTGIKKLDNKSIISGDYKEDIRDLVASILGKSDNRTQQKIKSENPEMNEKQMREYFIKGGKREVDNSRTIMPSSPRELPITDKGVMLIANKMVDYDETEGKSDKERLKILEARSVDKHRLGAKLIEIGKFLGWWNDLSEVFVNKELFAKDVSDTYHPHEDYVATPWYEIELPLKILGESIRNVFDQEYDHAERDIVTMEFSSKNK